MRRSLTILGTVLLAPLAWLSARAEVREIVLTPSIASAPPAPDDSVAYENSSFKEQRADANAVSRDGLIHLFAWIKDSNESPTLTDYVRAYEIIGTTPVLVFADEEDRSLATELTVWSVDFAAGSVGVTREFMVEMRFFDPFAHTARYTVKVTVANPLPFFLGWKRGDWHLHTFEGTNTVFEYGSQILRMAAAAISLGLDILGLTDHGESLSDARWADVVAKAGQATTATLLVMAGEEVNAAGSDGSLRHLTTYSQTRLLKTPSLYQSENNGSLWSIQRVLDSLVVQDGICFAAHPETSLVTSFGTIGIWTDLDYAVALPPQYANTFLGLEFYNQRVTRWTNQVTQSEVNPYPVWTEVANWQWQYDSGMRRYQALVRGLLVAVGGNAATVRTLWFLGASDAHGSHAYTSYNAYGLFDLAVHDSRLGAMHTLIYLPNGMTTANVKTAMRAGQLIVSDGPVMRPRVRMPDVSFREVGSRIVDPTGATLVLEAASSAEFGSFNSVFVIRITAAAVDTLPLPVTGVAFSAEFSLGGFCDPSQAAFLVFEGHTALGYRSVANPFIVGPAVATDVTANRDRGWFRILPNPAREQFMVQWGQQRPSLVEVFSASGRRLRTIVPDGSWVTLSGKRLPAGVYFIRATFPERTVAERIIIVR